MRKTLVWLGHIGGGFCAAFLAYVAIGGLVGRAIATPLDGAQGCWPTGYSSIAAHCDDPLVGALWFGAVELPVGLVNFPAIALLALIAQVDPPDWSTVASYAVINTLNVAVGAIVVGLMSLAGFVQWRARSPLVAWALVAALVGQIAFIDIRAWNAW